ncbi:hypothetical protein NL676_033717 [Syzygium grande]|nr:hypothetical protein NL676_033717 [Syzygium grande]
MSKEQSDYAKAIVDSNPNLDQTDLAEALTQKRSRKSFEDPSGSPEASPSVEKVGCVVVTGSLRSWRPRRSGARIGAQPSGLARGLATARSSMPAHVTTAHQ